MDAYEATFCPECKAEVEAKNLEHKWLCGECGTEYDEEQEAEECCAETEEEPKEE